MKKKFLIVSTQNSLPLFFQKDCAFLSPAGGIVVEEYELIKELLRKDSYELTLISWKGSRKYFSDASPNLKLVEAIKINKGIRHLINVAFAIWMTQPHYVFFKGPNALAYFYYFLSKLFGFIFIFRFSSDLQVEQPIIRGARRFKTVFKLISLLFDNKLPKIDIFLCQNHNQANKLKSQHPFGKIFVIHDFISSEIDLSDVKPMNQRKYIAWVGRFCEEKNMPALYQIVKELPEINFKIAGDFWGGYHHETYITVQKLKECKNVEFTGLLHPNEVIPFLNKAYALLMTSSSEGFSRTILESLIAGTPIVLTSKIDPDDIISTNNLGEVVSEQAELSGAIQKLLARQGYFELANRCREYILKFHTAEKGVEKLIDILRKLE